MIKELRDKYDLTQKEFAEKVGIPLRTIQSWEAGVRTAPDYVYNLLKYYLDNETVYVTRDREAGNEIEEFSTMEEAEAAIEKYEADDRRSDCYEPDFYEVCPRFKCHDKYILMYGNDNNGDMRIFENLEDLKVFAQALTWNLTKKELKNHYCTVYEFDHINKLRLFYDSPDDSLATKIYNI